MKQSAFFLFLLFILFSCKSGKSLFKSQRLHEQYAQKLNAAGLQQTALGRQWFSAAQKALDSPQKISLPYKELGYFPADKPRAAGLLLTVKRGEKLHVQWEKNPASGFVLFVELWRANATVAPSFLKSTDTTQTMLTQEADNDETYILRLQPELLQSGDYTLSIFVGPSLAFPVRDGKIESVWGDARDAGARKHEGIDIFAPKRSPALAAADGVVSSVREGGLGGKTIFLRPSGKNYSLYYAHLDEQLVTSGQQVTKGDTIGLVGNTGNAATTPPHLHFGIYTYGGAINPLPFVNPVVKKPDAVTIPINRLQTVLRSASVVKTEGRTYSAGVVLHPLAASAKFFRVQLPDRTTTEISLSTIQTTDKSLRQSKTKKDSFLLESPGNSSPRKMELKSQTPVKVLGNFLNYFYVEAMGENGWLSSDLF